MTDATSPASGHTRDAQCALRESPDSDDASGYGGTAGSEPPAAPDSGGASAWPGRPGAAHPAGWFPPAPGDAAPPVWPDTEPARTDAADLDVCLNDPPAVPVHVFQAWPWRQGPQPDWWQDPAPAALSPGSWQDPEDPEDPDPWQDPDEPDQWQEPDEPDERQAPEEPDQWQESQEPEQWDEPGQSGLWHGRQGPAPWPPALPPEQLPGAWQDVLTQVLPQVPVVGPTVALRGWAGSPGFVVPEEAMPEPRHPPANSVWQLAHRLWQDQGIGWEPPPMAPRPPAPSGNENPPDSPPRARPGAGAGTGQVPLPAPAISPPWPAVTAPQPTLAAPPPAVTAPQPVLTDVLPPPFPPGPAGFAIEPPPFPPGPAGFAIEPPPFPAIPSGFPATPLGAPILDDTAIASRPPAPPPRPVRPLLNEPDELYRAWQGSVRQAAAGPKLTGRRRSQAWQLVRVGVPAAVIVSVGAGAVIMLTGKPGESLAERANQGAALATWGGGAVVDASGWFAGYPGQQGTVTVSSIASMGGTQLAVGSADGHPAIWRRDSNGDWTLVSAGSPAVYRRPGTEGLTSIAHGPAGWIAVGDVVSGAMQQPIVVTSADGVTWQQADSAAEFAGPDTYVTGVTAGQHGYVIVGKQVRAGRVFAAMWWSADLRSWAAGSNGGLNGRLEPSTAYAVAGLGAGFVAAGTHGSGSAIWTSADGRTWSVHDIAAPAGASAAVLRLVTVNGSRVVAAGYAVTRAGDTPIVAVSADGGLQWTQAELAAPGGLGAVTALTAAGPGFVAAGQVGPAGDQRAVTWSSPDGLTWSAATPAGTAVRQITALSASGATVTGIAQHAAAPSAASFPAP